ncbi:ACP S-malonyltransferase [Campylobacter sp. IFREMER_LSEM_CL1846]|uniref:ACP S-malonyltransferase n=1 Tax=unclassified Campylobacter TaxID=2593542 RepID=UPI0021E6468D|nr:ACP S-malonyltransferase [Campylobacter sp. IFREMER_LSEM_CL1846]MCR8708516.1 ACP S-malonyltransferase [Campylobacter sp. RM5063]HEC1747688.1 ACP S-malonyltransferase [Campylobacter lari]MCV3434727.1 ACP S-malonyltransferase [Campylobacter sp. IFREMER_LSEM_CL1846]HEC1768664.1 ACP S-malonyltransferase [Campylobacter lari]HEC1789747.1 ACP S-malonyltransferase [Campylobacter lari]
MNSAFIFPGQGSQSVGMGLSFYENSLKARELLDCASDYCKIDFKNLLFKENENLNKSEFTQMAIVLNSLMAYEALKEQASIEAKYSLGHSLGEFSALATQGAFDFLDVIALVNKRGQFMQEDCSKIEAGMMVVLGLEDKVIEELCQKALSEQKSIFAANYNCEGQIVVAGLKPDLASYESEFKNAGAKRAMLLNMSVASHCPLLKNASLKLTKELELVLKDDFKSVVSNVNAKIYSDKTQALTLLSEQLIKPVLYKQSIKTIDNEVDFYIEFGASVLKGLNKKITQKETYALSKIEDIDEILKVIK